MRLPTIKFHETAVEKLQLTKRRDLATLLSSLRGLKIDLDCMDSGARGCRCVRCRNWRLLEKRLASAEFSTPKFNEILLLANMSPVSHSFFEYFFQPKNGRVDQAGLKEGVVRFRGFSMLKFGSFRYGYEALSSASKDDIVRKLKPYSIPSSERQASYRSRLPVAPLPYKIPHKDTHLLGYIAASKARWDIATAYAYGMLYKPVRALERQIGQLDSEVMESFEKRLKELRQQAETTGNPDADWVAARVIEAEELVERIEKVQAQGEINTCHYLALDELDVYVATSMREESEFGDVAEFVECVFKDKVVDGLHLRYFDPTQSYFTSRIDKGLMEGLMLKRADCTIYLVQETDTLGKDSELAATLAQGKPVIAYVPKRADVKALKRRKLQSLASSLALMRGQGVLEGEEWIAACAFLEEESFLSTSFQLVGDEDKRNRQKLKASVSSIVGILERAEKRLFNKRAKGLRESHPLALQVELDTGVANGVLVVRRERECAKLLRALLLNECEFSIKQDVELKAHLLIEKISKSPFRVVTDDPTLTNSFWSFYLKSKENPGNV